MIKPPAGLFSFSCFIKALGYNENPEGLARICTDQRPFVYFLSAPWKHGKSLRLLLASRNSLKTTTALLYVVWYMLRNPSKSVLIMSATEALAQTKLQEVRRIIGSSRFIKVFGDLRPIKDEDIYNASGVSLLIRPEVGGREPSCVASGLGGEKTGRHFDLVVCDDISGETNSQNEGARLGVIEAFRNLRMTAGIDSKFILIGTLWSQSEEIYSWVADNLKDQTEVLRLGCYSDKAGEVARFPNTLPLYKIKEYEATMPVDGFLGHYLVEKREITGDYFAEAWFQNTMPMPDINRATRTCRIFGGIDPAGHSDRHGDKKKSDFCSVVIVASIPELFRICILDGWFGRGGWDEQVKQCLDVILRYNPDLVVIERSLSGAFAPSLAAEAGRRCALVRLEQKPPPKGIDKKTRLLSLQPYFKSGSVFFASTCNLEYRKELTRQLCLIGKSGVHDDLPDSLWYALSSSVYRVERGFQGQQSFVTEELTGTAKDIADLKARWMNGELSNDDYNYWDSVKKLESDRQNGWVYDLV